MVKADADGLRDAFGVNACYSGGPTRWQGLNRRVAGLAAPLKDRDDRRRIASPRAGGIIPRGGPHNTKPMKKVIVSAVIASLALANAPAGEPGDVHQAAPMPPTIAAPQDAAYPGTVRLRVDATDLDRKIFRVRESIPVSGPGPVTLLYPKWLPGTHSGGGPFANLAGLAITASGQSVEWTRDAVEMSAFHVTVPQGAAALDLEFQYLSPVDGKGGTVVMTPDMVNLEWNSVVLYPAGYYVSRIPVEATVKLPDGWRFGTALETASAAEGATEFKVVSLDTLVDSPLFAGRYYRQVDLDPGARYPVRLNVVADAPEYLEIGPGALAAYHTLVQQVYKLFGSRHYDHYDFLLALSDDLGGVGLEHHRSSENVTLPRYFMDWDKAIVTRDLLPHEYIHSWNGKFRRPADLWTPDFNVPMRDSLLWVYEGQTDFWGKVVETRSGFVTKQQALDLLAFEAATFDNRPGRTWRTLQDTTNEPIIDTVQSTGLSQPIQWGSWARNQDYYWEGVLIWLDVDTLIIERTGGKKSLDDFARAFFGIEDGNGATVTYTFEDVVKALNDVVPNDWAAFLRERLDGHGPGAPLDGLARGGYRLVYTDKESEFYHSAEAPRKVADFDFSLGFTVDKDATLGGVVWNGPAFKAGLTDGTKIVAIGGFAYDDDRLRDAIREAAKPGAAPISLLVQKGNRFSTASLDYHGGLRYPHLERIAGTPALLDDILAPRK
jgi:predicted metalloprotease with PDZ domain